MFSTLKQSVHRHGTKCSTVRNKVFLHEETKRSYGSLTKVIEYRSATTSKVRAKVWVRVKTPCPHTYSPIYQENKSMVRV